MFLKTRAPCLRPFANRPAPRQCWQGGPVDFQHTLSLLRAWRLRLRPSIHIYFIELVYLGNADQPDHPLLDRELNFLHGPQRLARFSIDNFGSARCPVTDDFDTLQFHSFLPITPATGRHGLVEHQH